MLFCSVDAADTSVVGQQLQQNINMVLSTWFCAMKYNLELETRFMERGIHLTAALYYYYYYY